MIRAQSILKEVFGFETLWPLQERIVAHILEKKDALVVMPTGGGKSLCYQIPGMIFDGLTIVVSPLISLMKDQVDQLREYGVPALFLNSTLSIDEFRANISKLRNNRAKLLYIAPEALLTPRTLALISTLNVDCIAIDEAHCISEWGHDFRPEYRQLAEVREAFPDASCVALTATATPRVREDVRQSLKIEIENEFIGSFNRPNLFLEVIPKTKPLDQVLTFLERYPNESGIIYCSTRRQTEDLYSVLQQKGYSVRPYHAGLSERARTENQERFSHDDIQIIVATVAFGMGINKSNVRYVIHYNLPGSIDNYYQEIGRAGRDGLPAHCLLLFGYGDIQKVQFLIRQKSAKEQRVANILLSQLVGFAETDLCRRIPLLNYFGETDVPDHCGMCDNCCREKDDTVWVDLTVPAQMFLSCVKRTGQSFGASHISDVLRGSNSQKITKFGHEKLSTYGIGKAYSANQWCHIARQLIQKSLLVHNYEHGSLELTSASWEVLQGKKTFLGILEEAKRGYSNVSGRQDTEEKKYDSTLFEILRKKRKELADQENLPPFTIFHDRTLREMAIHYPQTKEDLLTLYGIGKRKLEKYGDVFLELIREYCQAHQILGEKQTSIKEPAPASSEEIGTPRYLVIGERFNQGCAIDQLSKEFNIKNDTVLNHLYLCLKSGMPFQERVVLMNSSLSEEQRQQVLSMFARLGTERLKPIFDDLNGKISYEELKILRLYCLCHQQHPENYQMQDHQEPPSIVEVTSPSSPKNDPPKGWYDRIGERIDRYDRTEPKSENQPSDEQNHLKNHKTFVCLAVSRKYGGYCLAGKEWIDGKVGNWLRPVSSSETGELSTAEIRMNNGAIPQCMDIITIETKGNACHAYQSENVHIAEKRPVIWQSRLHIGDLHNLVDDVDSLWLNGFHSSNGENDRLPEEVVMQASAPTLYLIRPDGFSLVVSDDTDGRKRVQARFIYHDIPYLLSVTDPHIERIFLRKDHGEYPLCDEVLYLTISLGEPFYGYCYKLAAAVITQNE